MKLKKFLKLNNIALIDPNNTFHASCIEFYNKNGFLTFKQVHGLRNNVLSPDDIIRLTTKPEKENAIPTVSKKKTKTAKKVAKFDNIF